MSCANDLPDSANEEAKLKDRRARAEIGLCLEVHHLPTFRVHKTAKSLWEALEKLYQEKSQGRRLVLTAQLIHLKKGLVISQDSSSAGTFSVTLDLRYIALYIAAAR